MAQAQQELFRDLVNQFRPPPCPCPSFDHFLLLRAATATTKVTGGLDAGVCRQRLKSPLNTDDAPRYVAAAAAAAAHPARVAKSSNSLRSTGSDTQHVLPPFCSVRWLNKWQPVVRHPASGASVVNCASWGLGAAAHIVSHCAATTECAEEARACAAKRCALGTNK